MTDTDIAFNRYSVNSQVVSMLWCAVSERGKWHPVAKQKLQDAGFDIQELDRMFLSREPRVSLRRVADILHALGLGLRIEAIGNGVTYTASGRV